jgi:glycosyltransferase involved in cell wall biosynthesis
MYRNKTITLCMPCRNEAENLQAILKQVPEIVDETIIISNKSIDDSVRVARDQGAKVIIEDRTTKGIGYGFAHMRGIEAAAGDIIIGADADGSYPLEDIPRIIDTLLDKKLDFISCNRYPLQSGTTIPLKLRLGVGLLNLQTRLLYGTKVNDILSGMWVFDARVKDQLHLTMGDWNLSPQIKLNAITSSAIAFEEFAISQHHRLGSTHQNYFKTGWSHAVWILKNRFARAADSRVKVPIVESE